MRHVRACQSTHRANAQVGKFFTHHGLGKCHSWDVLVTAILRHYSRSHSHRQRLSGGHVSAVGGVVLPAHDEVEGGG